MRLEQISKNYTSHPLNGGSDRYGVCEVCKKNMQVAFMGKFYTVYKDSAGGTINPWFDKFAHDACITEFGDQWVSLP